ncbi:uncharacterized protein DNG_07720 [Cephalotrichum gorgonifer]|uniref:Ornithine cyclodeaminase n=1 Tax=Cephalotrichum gorgonifer TaxID=2041049 RepID=A0AAE8N579_9PEZI|nr:uncharacterized protein DNG_07720 [Cephalotrichum gorgonifer]
MSTLTVLTNDQVKSVLDNLTLEQFHGFQAALTKALHEYSTDAEAGGNGAYYQPPRIHYSNPKTGATSLFMPSIGPTGMGVKVVTLSTPAKDGEKAGDEPRPVIRPTGAVTVFAPDGSPKGFLHAGALTAFRTALATSCLTRLRSRVENVVVFGAGKQAYWHLRQALLLKGATIRNVTAINRSRKSAADMIDSLAKISPDVKSREGWTSTDMEVLAPGDEDYDSRTAQSLLGADVIICCTPSTVDLFSGDLLTSEEGRKKTRLIAAVGSYTPHMRELPEKLLLQATGATPGDPVNWGSIVADTIHGVITEAGEIIQANIPASQLIEFGEMVTLHDPASETKGGEARARWLAEGNVVFKCVGLGLMDLVASTHLIDLTAELGLGTQIEGFDSVDTA